MNKKRSIFLVLLFSIIFTLTACTNETDKNKNNNSSLKEDTSETGKKDDNENNNSPLSGSQTLNVATYSSIDKGMQEKIKSAMKEIYPDFELNLITFPDEDTYNKNIQASLMSGQPYDLIYVDNLFQMDKFIENEYFKDIYELIENDKSVNIDDYYVNALKAYETNGKLYRMPMNFFYQSLIGINTKISKESIDQYKKLDCISVTSMLDIFKKNKGNNNLFLISAMEHWNMIRPSIVSYINFENKTSDFYNDRFMNFLTDIKDSMFSVTGYEAYYEKSAGYPSNQIEKDYDIINSNSMFTRRLMYNLPQSLLDYVDPYFDHFIPMANENDELIISSNKVYCIGNTANAEMAWDFLKFYINIYNEDLTLFETMISTDIPIKKEYFVIKATNFMYTNIAALNGISIQVGDKVYGADGINYGGELIYDIDTTFKRAIEKLEKFNKMPMINVQRIDTDGSLYNDVIDDFMKGLITVDQAARQIQNNMTIYLSE